MEAVIKNKQVIIINYKKTAGAIVVKTLLPLEIKMVGNTLYLYGTDLHDRLQTKRFIYQNIVVVNYPKKGRIPQYALDEWNRVKREFLGKFRQR